MNQGRGSIRQAIKRCAQLREMSKTPFHNSGLNYQLELQGEPMIYSVTFRIGERLNTRQFVRDKKFRSILRCVFRSYYLYTTPLAILVTFYVSPPDHVDVSSKLLEKEKTPAVRSFELCDYYLSFLEMITRVLYSSHKQVCHVEMNKFYSNNPRTVLKFMKYEHYEKFKNDGTLYPETKSKRPPVRKRNI